MGKELKKVQFENLVIHDFEESEFHLPSHSHTYYELVYIWAGNGTHILNQTHLDYGVGDLFLVCPGDIHHFVIHQKTHFTFIKFTDAYFSSFTAAFSSDFHLNVHPTSMMKLKFYKERKIQFDRFEANALRRMVKTIVEYNVHKEIFASTYIYYQVIAIFGLIKDLSVDVNESLAIDTFRNEDLLLYIHQHIYQPSLIQVKVIAAHFSLSANYFSDFFKKEFGISFRQYINDYKLQIIENRLIMTSVTIKEIAEEFGFSDESHFTKFFTRHKKIGPKKYRQLKREKEKIVSSK